MQMLIGAAAVFFASLYIGMAASSLYRVRAEQLEAFRSLIGYIGSQIDGYLSPLDVIYRGCEDKRLRTMGFLTALCDGGGTYAVEKCACRMFLTKTELSELTAFFCGLGHSSADEEVRHCKYYENRFAQHTAKAREELIPKARMYRAFGMLIGIMLIVILL